MSVTVVALRNLNLGRNLRDRWTHRALSLLLFWSLLYVWSLPGSAFGYAGIGGYISEKLLSNTGTGDSSLYLGNGTEGPVVLGAGPTITTNAASGATLVGGVASATLNGTLSSLNSFPQADIWFTWGYDAGATTNTTAVVTVAATGAYSADISGFDPGRTIYYRFQSSTDGTSQGAIVSFHVTGGAGLGYWILWNLLPILIALGLFVSILRLSSNWMAALIAAAIGLMTIFMAQNILRSIWS